MNTKRYSPSELVALAVLSSLLLFLFVNGHGAQKEIDLVACRAAVAVDSRPSRLVCDLSFIPTPEERDELSRHSLGVVDDLRCLVSIDISRMELESMLKPGTWHSPKQSPSCRIVTSERPYDAHFTVTSTVSLGDDGEVLFAKLGADDVVSVPPLIARFLEDFIRFSLSFEMDFTRVIQDNLNGWLGLRRPAAA